MTDNGQVGEITSQSQNAPSQPVSTPAVAPQPRYYSDDELNGIVSAKKQKAYEKGRDDARAELSQNQSTAQQTLTPEKIREEARTAAKAEWDAQQRQQLDQQNQVRAQQFVQQFSGKMQVGKEKHSDFEQVVSPLQLHTIPDVVQLANDFENTHDIMYDLGKNPSKVASLMVLAKAAPHLAYQEMQKLSQSIKQNETAKANQPNVREPLSQVRPSNTGADNGSQTINDLRAQPWLRG